MSKTINAELKDPQITNFLADWSEQGNDALLKLFPLVLQDLRRMAKAQFRNERKEHTLQPTALINECYLHLANAAPLECENRDHFFALAARIMRRILVDHARYRNRDKRPGSAEVIELQEEELPFSQDGFVDVIGLDAALSKLWKVEDSQAKTAELRLFAGLSFSEIAQILDVTERTAKRKWAVAKIFLHKELTS